MVLMERRGVALPANGAHASTGGESSKEMPVMFVM